MQVNYCLPIIKKRKTDVLKTIQENSTEYQYFEIWLDEIEDLDDFFIKELISLLHKRVLFLFRQGMLKKSSISLEERFRIMSLFDGTKVLLDLDVSQRAELEYLQTKKIRVKTIVSYHNYKETPRDLEEIVSLMDIYNPTIYKVATMCKTEEDAIGLLELQQVLKKQKKKHIVLGMGSYGTITRIFGTLWGNEMIFAPQTLDEQSAPGQLTKSQLEKIFREL